MKVLPPVSQILLALALGLLVRQLLPTPVRQAAPTKEKQAIHSPAPSNVAVLATASDVIPSLEILTKEEFAERVEELRSMLDEANPQRRDLAIQLLILQAAQREPSECAGLVMRLAGPDLAERWLNVLFYSAYPKWAANDPEAALANLDQISPKNLKSNAMETAFSAWAGKDILGAKAFLEKIPKGPAYGFLALAIANQDHNLGSEYRLRSALATPESQNLSEDVVGMALKQSLGPETEQTIALLTETNWTPEEKERLLPCAVDALAGVNESKRHLVVPAILKLVEGEDERFALLQQTLESWGGSYHYAPAEMLSHIMTLPEGSLRQRLLPEVAKWGVTVRTHETEALLPQVPESSRQDFLRGLAQGWIEYASGSYEPGFHEAHRIIGSLPTGTEREELFADLAAKYGRSSDTGASQWLGQLPVGPDRDAAVSGFAKEVFLRDPEAALTWTATIQNGDLRQSHLQQFLPEWRRVEPEAADAWMLQAGVSLPGR